ncbi:MAG TPA: hypothetical protein VJT50_02245 [Pyrinomonadaceae bacterium]|nr:hypothetical protein [Pyrinomonadaceae bacterium]
MNYFNYFTEIEDAFIRRRGKHLLLSPIDWALIESWKEINVPLHVVLRGIEKSFDSWESKPRKRSVKSLLYCQEEIEAQYAEWLEAHVGSNADNAEAAEQLPFQRAAILDHLKRGQEGLAVAAKKRKQLAHDELAEALARAGDMLAELAADFAETNVPDAQKLELSLTSIERMLSDVLLTVAPQEHIEAATKEVEHQLKPYRKQMEPVIYEQTKSNLILKRMRDLFDIPRLSLFYL